MAHSRDQLQEPFSMRRRLVLRGASSDGSQNDAALKIETSLSHSSDALVKTIQDARQKIDAFESILKLQSFYDPNIKLLSSMIRGVIDDVMKSSIDIISEFNQQPNSDFAEIDRLLALVKIDERVRDIFDQRVRAMGYVRVADITRSIGKKERDVVADEIAAANLMRWSDRKLPENKQRPWAWLKRADLFVAHVYKRWLDQGKLKLKHLSQDEQLYAAYLAFARRRPELKLNLLENNGGDDETSRILRRAAHGWLPPSEITPAELEDRRTKERERKRKWRISKRGLG